MHQQPITLTVSSRIYKDPRSDTGMFVAVIEAWDIATSAKTAAEAQEMVWRLIEHHIAAARKLGVLDRELAKIGVTGHATEGHIGAVRMRLAFEEEREITI